MNNDIIGYIIGAISVTALLTGIVWMIFIRSGRPKMKFFRQKTFESNDGFRCIVQKFSDDLSLANKYKAEDVFYAARAVYLAAEEQGFEIEKQLSVVAIAIYNQNDYMQKARVIPGQPSVAVFEQYQDHIYNSWIPFIAINDNLAKDANIPQLIIHELLHGASLWTGGGEDPYHKNDYIWKKMNDSAVQKLKTYGER